MKKVKHQTIEVVEYEYLYDERNILIESLERDHGENFSIIRMGPKKISAGRCHKTLHKMITHIQTNAQEITDDNVLMPKELTAENGAKYLMMGEFKQEMPIYCPECTNRDTEDCETCAGEGELIQEANISWTNIKEIYKKAVEHLGKKAPPPTQTG